jgi:hypothetical protein
MSEKLVHLEDFYYLPDGRMVFTEAYLLKRGFCCGKGCLHCPYDGVQGHESSSPTDLLTVQCPFCFERFGISATSHDGMQQDFIYDCEVCCRPIQVEVDFSSGWPKVNARAT